MLGLCAAIGVITTTSANAAGGAFGVVVPDGSKQIAKARFRSSKDWDRTIRFYRSVYRREKAIVFQYLPSPPTVKALHIENTKPGQTWESINVYQSKDKVYIYVIANRNAKKSKSKSRRKKTN